MRKKTDIVIDREGNAVAGAEVYVRKESDNSLATLYSDDGVTVTANPAPTDNDGTYSYYAANNDYKLEVYVEGVNQKTVRHDQHYDLAAVSTYGWTFLASSTAGAALTNLGVSSFVQTVLDDADAASVRTTLGLGSSSTLASSAVFQVANNLSEGTASTMRSNLGLGSIATFPETTAGQYAANTSGKALSTDKVWSAADTVALTDAATVALDLSTGINFSVTLGGNRTLGNPSNTTNGKTGVIYITQDGTGSRTLAYSSNWKFATGTAPVLSTTAGAVDMLFYQVKSSSFIFGTLIKDVK